MQKVINGFNVEVVKATIYPQNVKSELIYNTDSKEWQVVSTVDRIELSYTVNNVLEVGGEYYRPENFTYLPKAFEREAAEAKALAISVEDLKAITTEILTDFFSKTPSMIPNELQYYGEADKFMQCQIKALFTTYYYKGVTFILKDFEFTDSTEAHIRRKIVVDNKPLEYTRFNFENTYGGICEELDHFFEVIDLEEDIVFYISELVFMEDCG